jgi:hypothetical protein
VDQIVPDATDDGIQIEQSDLQGRIPERIASLASEWFYDHGMSWLRVVSANPVLATKVTEERMEAQGLESGKSEPGESTCHLGSPPLREI